MCAGNELFFVGLYVMKFTGPLNSKFVFYTFWHIIITNLSLVFWWSAVSVAGVICFLKQFINVIQIVNASKTLAAIDQEDRAVKAN